MRYFPKSDDDVRDMLEVVGKKSIDELFASIPAAARIKNALRLPKKLDELALKREFASAQAAPSLVSFLGAGATPHFVPEWVSQQLLRAEWYTSYTPYQPEASQGTLQAVFEFQSMVASLFGLDIANASMYDGATALVEALLMAVRITGKKTVMVSSALHPEYRACVKTYGSAAGLQVIEVGFDNNGHTDIDGLSSALAEASTDCAAVAIQSPNFFGRLEATTHIAALAHNHHCLAVQTTTDMSSLAITTSPGNAGIDIAVGDGLGLLGALHLGGPGVGLMAVKKAYLRQMPGRLVGLTHDHNGSPGYVLTLSTREQHIRREKATSNICTNHNLMALAFAMTLSAYGKRGFRELAITNVKKTLFFRQCMTQLGGTMVFAGPHYNETVIPLGPYAQKRLRVAQAHGIVAGVLLERFYPDLVGHLLVSCTELHRDEDIKRLAAILCGVHDDQT